jgi:hypothetical protein
MPYLANHSEHNRIPYFIHEEGLVKGGAGSLLLLRVTFGVREWIMTENDDGSYWKFLNTG